MTEKYLEAFEGYNIDVERIHRTLIKDKILIRCPLCGKEANGKQIRRNFMKCPKKDGSCEYHYPFTVKQWALYLAGRRHLREILLDPDLAVELESRHPRYKEKVKQAKERTRSPNGLAVFEAKIKKHPVILTILNGQFLKGTIGPHEGEKFARALKEAEKRNIPVVGIWTSGGMNMNLTDSLFEMPKISGLIEQLKVPYISILTGEVYGGTSVSFIWGDIVTTEQGSKFGFSGPKIIANYLYKGDEKKLPPDFQTTKEAIERGKVDMVLRREDIKNTLVNILNVFDPKNYSACRKMIYQKPEIEYKYPVSRDLSTIGCDKKTGLTNWDIVKLAKYYKRPTSSDYLSIFDTFIELKGDRISKDEPQAICGIGLIEGMPVVSINTEKGKHIRKSGKLYADLKYFYNSGLVGPAGERKMLRVMKIAEKNNLPIIVLIDTPGADMVPEAERNNISYGLHRPMAEMKSLKTHIIAINIGEGGSGGFINLYGNSDRRLMMKHSFISTADPEAIARIMYEDIFKKDKEKALEMAANNSDINVDYMLKRDHINEIIKEPKGGADKDPELAKKYLKLAILEELYNYYFEV